MKKEMNITNRLKNMNLYKKEQLVICIVLIGFAVSGISLPIVKDKMPHNSIPQDTICITYQTEENANDTEADESGSNLEDAKSTETDKSGSAVEDAKGIEKDGSNRNTEGEQSRKDGEKTVNDKGGTINNDIKDKSTNTNDSGRSPSPPPPEPAPKPPTPSESSDSPEKTWVPPVYKTVHHEAVYETRKVYICNYCSATFNSAGEFQVHKDENGG